MQGLSVPFACVGSGDPVRVLRLYTRIHWIYFEAFISETYVQLVATDANVLCAQALRSETPNYYYCCSRTVLCGALYTACVDASRTVFWDRSVLR